MMVEQSMIDVPSFSGSLKMNGSVDKVNLYSRDKQSSPLGRGYGSIPPLGLTGLYNLGNTCFMNSAIQCLVHTPKLVDYFLGDFRKDLNFENSLRMHGKLAIAFGDLSRKLWAPRTTPVSPRMFKSILASFAPQFSGYNQHDSQEFLAFLLDGLHEDLNRVKHKPYAELKEEDDRPDVVVADEYWRNHISRNDSIIVYLCQGQYRSSLACPVCKKLSITFDPFMYLSLPLPSTTLRKMTLTVVSTEGPTLPYTMTISVPNNGSLEDLVQALGTACLLREDEMLLIAEELEDLGTAEYSTRNLQLIKWYSNLQKYWNSSPYYYEGGSERTRNEQKPDVERLSDKNSQVANAKPPLWHFIKLDIDHVPAELARGDKKEKLGSKRVRWNPESEGMHKFDLFEKLEQKHQGQEGKENKENEDQEEEDEKNEEEAEEEFSDEGDYEQNEYFDDDEDDYNMANDNDDEPFF